VVEALLNRSFTGTTDIDGESWVATSAGTGRYQVEMDEYTVAAAAEVGIDISAHRPRLLDRNVLRSDGVDLVLTLARIHLPSVVGLDTRAWPRTFTLKELARRAAVNGPPTPAEGFVGWRDRMADGRTAASMMQPDAEDDVADPYGLPRPHHVKMVAEVSEAVDRLLRHGPWVHQNRDGASGH
jgi:protein-tyrosine-phosphatase